MHTIHYVIQLLLFVHYASAFFPFIPKYRLVEEASTKAAQRKGGVTPHHNREIETETRFETLITRKDVLNVIIPLCVRDG
jgi:hypothetical protein